MAKNLQSLWVKIFIAGGFVSFILNGGTAHSLLWLSLVLFAGVLVYQNRVKIEILPLLLPFSSGLLCWLMRFFFWDTFDYQNRVHNLLLISLITSLYLLFKHFRWLRKFLFYFNHLSLKKRLLMIFVIGELIFILFSFIIVKREVIFVGDEPHYLAISHSIAKDFDLNVFNQYFRKGYQDFLKVKRLRAHAAFGVGYKKMYSIHLPGISITIAPFLLFKIPLPLLYFLIRAYLGLFGALLAVVAYLFALRLWKHKTLSITFSAIFVFTAPVFFLSFHIFPEVQVLLLVLSSLYLLLFGSKSGSFHPLAAGFLLGIMVFWGLKYNIFIYLIGIGFLVYFICQRRYKQAILFALFPLIFQSLFFYYLYMAYGSVSFQAIYRGIQTADQMKDFYSAFVSQIPLSLRIETLLDYFFDQRDGLLLYNPVYFFAFPGLILALKKFKKYRMFLLISLPAFAFICYHAFSTVRAGHCPQGRYLVPVAWMLMIFIVIYYRESRNLFLKRLILYLPLYSFLIVVYQAFYPLTLYQSTTHKALFRPGLIFQQWGNIHFQLDKLLPSFIKVDGNMSYLPNILFILLFVFLVVWALMKVKTDRISWGRYLIFLLLLCLFCLFPRLPLYNPVQLNRDGIIPYMIHGKNLFPARVPAKVFTLKSEGFSHYTLSTLKPAGEWAVELTNKGEEEARVGIFSFDQPQGTIKLKKGEVRQVLISKLQYKKIKNRFFYRLTIKIETKKTPQIVFHFYPKN